MSFSLCSNEHKRVPSQQLARPFKIGPYPKHGQNLARVGIPTRPWRGCCATMAITRERRNILPFVLELSGLRGSQANHQSPSALKDSRNQRNRRTLSVQFEGKPPPTKGANGCSTPICSLYFTGDLPTPCHESVFLQEGVGEATKKDLTT